MTTPNEKPSFIRVVVQDFSDDGRGIHATIGDASASGNTREEAIEHAVNVAVRNALEYGAKVERFACELLVKQAAQKYMAQRQDAIASALMWTAVEIEKRGDRD